MPFVLVLVAWAQLALPARGAVIEEPLSLRGRTQTLRLYGPPAGTPIVVLSGDGGWIHLGPHAAERLASSGFHVVGFDVKAYLETFSSRTTALTPAEVQRDFESITARASQGSPAKPILVGVSEGAGLAVLAATDAHLRPKLGGVVALGLPAVTELAWRWKDAIVYLTHGVPNEPAFQVEPLMAHVSPLPLAAIYSTHDEFVSPADAHRLFDAAAEPKRLWMVPAVNHRFSDNLQELDARLIEAIAWVTAQPRSH